ncbi:MAG: AEC family transporter [Rhodobacteraceae bacterium]|nr:AEC family transporter [Paracoccaceae bacterium]
MLSVLFDPILPVFAIMVLGYALGRSGKATVDDARQVNRFAMTVFLPILIFGLIANAPITNFSMVPVAIYASVEALVFITGFFVANRLFNRPANESILLAFCGVFSNNAFFVLPISVLLYGQESVLAITTIVTLDGTFTFTGAMIALQIIDQGRAKPAQVMLEVAKLPIMQAVFWGVIISLSGLHIPTPIQTFVSFNGAAAAPLALFALGIVLSSTRFRLDAAIVTFSGIKLLFFPAAIWLALETFASNDPQRDLFLFGAAGPSGTVAFSLALFFGVKTDAIAQIVIWTSILSLFSLAMLA